MLKVNHKKLKAYGDRLDDGLIQMSFTLPISASPEAKEAAKRLVEAHGFEKIAIATRMNAAELASDDGYELKKLTEGQGFVWGNCTYFVAKYAKAVGFDLFFGTELEIIKGKFTGKTTSLDSAYNKAKIVKDLSQKYQADLNKSIAVGDTETDVPMLKLVGRPIAFNPNLSNSVASSTCETKYFE